MDWKSLVEFDYGVVSSEIRSALLNIATFTRNIIQQAGLSVQVDGELSSVGAEVEIDFGDDAAGGVFVTWHADPALTEVAAQSVSDGRFDDPSIIQSGAISEVMRDAIIQILQLAKCVAEPSNDDMRPLALRVTSIPPSS
ncbi:hypothetical protein [Actinoplanes sp. TFC3]|uniref:hypothetical protein n=1 Tax=Actinoplanes sp. TFC3 TaxID=1710355 RepID=UPI0012900B3D|nr:hypothetical protein [Actinoplanes sp. TFC3]